MLDFIFKNRAENDVTPKSVSAHDYFSGRRGSCHTPILSMADGTIYEIDRILDKRPAASTKVGGCGIRYTVRIRGCERYLFEEDGRWFLEAPCYQ